MICLKEIWSDNPAGVLVLGPWIVMLADLMIAFFATLAWRVFT